MTSKLYALYFAWLLCCFAALGSLYFSEIRHLEPCHLCWYQRICLYPLVIILGIAVYKSSFEVIPYIYPQVIIGLLIAFYQIVIQEVPNWQPIELCGAGPSCSVKIDIGLGPITIPMLSAGVYLLVALLMGYTSLGKRTQKKLSYLYISKN